jgi:hypothetical protein
LANFFRGFEARVAVHGVKCFAYVESLPPPIEVAVIVLGEYGVSPKLARQQAAGGSC